jgi:excisionase family DNA binding protein
MVILQLDSEQLSTLIQSAVRKAISEVSQNNSTQPEADQLLTIKPAAEFLSLSVPTMYTLVSKAEIPVSKRGNRLYFSKQELTDWIKAGRKKTIAEIEDEADKYLSNKKRLNNGK